MAGARTSSAGEVSGRRAGGGCLMLLASIAIASTLGWLAGYLYERRERSRAWWDGWFQGRRWELAGRAAPPDREDVSE